MPVTHPPQARRVHEIDVSTDDLLERFVRSIVHESIKQLAIIQQRLTSDLRHRVCMYDRTDAGTKVVIPVVIPVVIAVSRRVHATLVRKHQIIRASCRRDLLAALATSRGRDG